MRSLFVVLLLLGSLCPAESLVADEPNYTRKEDVIYARKFGTALTLDVFTPKKNANGAGVVFAVSGGWYSNHGSINIGYLREFLDRGYTVFAVVHGSQPKFTIPEILDDMHRAVRFVRHHAKTHGVDPDRLGISGGSAGGHLSLMIGTTGKDGNPDAKDPVDKESSRVQAVACFYPPTDFLNYGKKDELALGSGTLAAYKAPFDFTEFNTKTNSFDPVTDAEKRLAIGKRISPIYHVSGRTPPTFIMHGDKDLLVPYQQAESMIEKLKEAKVPCKLETKKDAAHGWPALDKDIKHFADWFDEHLKKR
jgi:acetyl esterase/lipase